MNILTLHCHPCFLAAANYGSQIIEDVVCSVSCDLTSMKGVCLVALFLKLFRD